MEFNWRGAIDRNWENLCSIAARLTLMAAIQAGRGADTLPRQLYLRILAILRPAEFAARRLIAMAACKLPLDVGPVRPAGAPKPSSPPRGEDTKACERSELAEVGEGASSEPRVPAFALFDPFKPFREPWLTEAEIAALDNPSAGLVVPVSRPNEPVDARALRRRIRALSNALEDLDGQALRLARWRARRAAGFGRPIRFSPFRPGFPPGWKKRPKTEIEEVLKECNYLGLEAWDTT
jgi:hypothetical protein